MPNEDEAFDELFQAEYASVLSTVFLVCRDYQRAQDVTQEAFVQLLRRWDRVSRFDRPGAWVRRVAIRLAQRSVGREALRRRAEATAVRPEAADPLEAVDVDVVDAIGKVSPAQRVTVVLFYYERLTLQEIAHVLGCSSSTVGVHLHRARARLEALLEEVDSDGGR
jgi:RNA polymerase sigma-70 factor (ECF subfamily)